MHQVFRASRRWCRALSEALEPRRLLAGQLSFSPSLAYSEANFDAYAIAATDLNDDFYPDLVVDRDTRNDSGELTLLVNNKNGTFKVAQRISRSIASRTQAIADFTGDGVNDIIDIPFSSPIAQIYVGNGDGTVKAARNFPVINNNTNPGANDAAAADFNNDGKMDLAITGTLMPSLIMLGNGNGGFATRVIINPGAQQSLALGDLNGDKKQDLITTEYREDFLNLWFGRGTGDVSNPVQVGTPAYPKDAVVVDFNGDGKKDIAMAEYPTSDFSGKTQSVRTLIGDGKGGFTNVSSYNPGVAPSTIESADFDGDFVPDLIVGSLPGDFVSVYSGNGNGAFKEQVRFDGEAIGAVVRSHQIAVADFNHDGKMDVALNTVDKKGVVVLTNTAIFQSRVYGQVYNDYNGNGKFDIQIEKPLIGVSVYIDQNSNGVRDASEPRTITTASTFFEFVVPPSTIQLRVETPAGWLQMAPNPQTTNGSLSINVGQGEEISTAGFGIAQPGSVSGRVYYDTNANAISEDKEQGEFGFRVYVDLNKNSTLDAGEPAAYNNGVGVYKIVGVRPGIHTIRLLQSEGVLQTGPAPTAGGAPGSYTQTVFGGFEGGFTDFGIIYPAYVTGKLIGFTDPENLLDLADLTLKGWNVFIDYNGNGIADIGEPYTLTDAEGNYRLASAIEGTFDVRVTQRSGYQAGTPSGGRRGIAFVQGETVSDIQFTFKHGALNNAGLKPPVNLPAGANPVGITTGDYNVDGKPDFAVLDNLGGGKIFLGNGKGGFLSNRPTFTGGDAARSLISADVNGDGKPDLITANQDTNDATVSIGNGDGTFKAGKKYSATDGAFGVTAADFDGDEAIDLAVAGMTSGNLAILLNKGNGTFNAPKLVVAGFGNVSVAAGDFNGDKKIDLAAVSESASSLALLIGNGNGTFKPATFITDGIVQPTFVDTADFNRDGKADLAVINRFSDVVRVILGNGNGTLSAGTNYDTGSGPRKLIITDVNQDGLLDLAIACMSDGTSDISGGLSILRGRGDGRFLDPLNATGHTSPIAVGLADFDRNGKSDLVAANFFSDDVSVLLNGNTAPPGVISGLVWNDINKNGKKDSGEAGLAGRIVYVDFENDGKRNGMDFYVTTAAGGAYNLYDLEAGSHIVRLEVPTGSTQTSPAKNGAHGVKLEAGRLILGKNFGIHTPPATLVAAAGSISGSLFNDVDLNGIKKSEPALSGWTVFIDANGNRKLDVGEHSAKTNSKGAYILTNLPTGKYNLRVEPQADWRSSPPSQATRSIALSTALPSATAIDFGLTQKAYVSGTVFNDLNGDGKQQSAETGLAKWRVFIDDDEDGKFDSRERSTFTDADGVWVLDNLDAGRYVVTVVQQSKWKLIAPVGKNFVLNLPLAKVLTGRKFAEQTIP